MSWDASLTDDRGHSEGEWNYTHNTNGMIDAVLERPVDENTWAAQLGNDIFGSCWWKVMDGMDGATGRAFLEYLIGGLEAEPARFCAMNPENGWGSYAGVLGVLREMRDAIPDWPCTWRLSG